MVQAAATGAIDFAQADPREPWWWTKLVWTLEEVNRKNTRDMLLDRQRYWLALVSHGSLQDDAFKAASEKAATNLEQLRQQLFPWLPSDATLNQAQQLRNLWISVYGDPNSPETKAMIAQGIRAMRSIPSVPVKED